MDAATVLRDMEAAERAFERVQPEMDAITPAEFTAMNVDVVSGASVALGVAGRILEYRERMASLPEFNMRHVDNLVSYATAAWFVFITNLSSPDPGQFQPMMQECALLRSKLLLWAEPLVTNGNFDAAAIDKIKDGVGNKDIAGDVVALVGLYRSKWTEVEGLCAVTEADLDRGAQIGPVVFAMVSQREQQKSRAPSADSQRVRRAWTLLDRAYDQCQRALTFLLWDEGSVDLIAPSLRRNSSSRRSSSKAEVSVDAPAPQPPAAPPADGLRPIGDGQGPFAGPGE